MKKNDYFPVYLGYLTTSLGNIPISIEDIGKSFDLKKEDITSKTGVTKLFRLNESIVESAVEVGRQILQGIKKEVKGIFASCNLTSSDFLMPSFATSVAAQIPLKNVVADSIGIGCAGGLQSLRNAYNQLITDYITNNEIGSYLVITGDRTSTMLDPEDQKTAFLFSEGVVGMIATTDPGLRNQCLYEILCVKTKTLGGNVNVLKIPNPYVVGYANGLPKLSMDGAGVYKFGISIFKDMLELAGLEKLPERTYFIPHQANLRMLQKMIEVNKLDPKMVYTDGIKNIGNTSGPAVFFGLADALERKLVTKQQKVLLGVFGAELQVGSALLASIQ